MPRKKKAPAAPKATKRSRKLKREVASDVLQEVVKIEEVEALRFAKLDTEIRNAVQGSKLIDFEIDKLNREFEAKLRELRTTKTQLEASISGLRPQYQDIVTKIGEKYSIAPEHVIIDPDSLIIRDGSKN